MCGSYNVHWMLWMPHTFQFQKLNVNLQKTIINGCCIFRQDILNYDKIITNVFIVFLQSVTNSKILCKFIPYKNEQYSESFILPTLFFTIHIMQQWNTLWFFNTIIPYRAHDTSLKYLFYFLKSSSTIKKIIIYEIFSLISCQNKNIHVDCYNIFHKKISLKKSK
jgi:hypothetical protein